MGFLMFLPPSYFCRLAGGPKLFVTFSRRQTYIGMMMEDMELVQEYARRRSEEAFAALVSRHVNLVFSVALRQLRDASLAEEVTQAVFIILARKAGSLGPKTILSAWLCRTAQYAAANALRTERRRQRREQEAYMQSLLNPPEPETSPWTGIAPLLDSAMAGLGERDHSAIVLRFFEGKDLKQVGAALGVNENAAKTRVSRAVEKLRQYFVKRGVILPAAVLTASISANSVQAAPVALAKSVSAAAIARGAAASSSTSTLIKGTLKLMAWTKLKVATLAGVGLLLASGTVIVAVKTKRPPPPDPAAAEKMWDQYSQVFALGLRGPEARDAVVQVMTNHPPTTLIRLTHLPRPGQTGGLMGKIAGMGTPEGHVQMGAPLVPILRYAHGLDPKFPQNRIIIPDALAYARYDFVDTNPQGGGREVLQRALKDQFGLVARREMRKNLVLTVKNPAAASLHKHGDGSATGAGRFHITMAKLANELGKRLGVEVTDQTGLAGEFDYTLDTPDPQAPDKIIKAIVDQLGLELTPAADNQQVEFLVAEKVR
jgi:uncharacterized protein (TIGR03435 family)